MNDLDKIKHMMRFDHTEHGRLVDYLKSLSWPSDELKLIEDVVEYYTINKYNNPDEYTVVAWMGDR
jgi:hypothetical protein